MENKKRRRLETKILGAIFLSLLILTTAAMGLHHYFLKIRGDKNLHYDLNLMQQIVFKDILQQMTTKDKNKVSNEIANQVKRPEILSISISNPQGIIKFSADEKKTKPKTQLTKIMVSDANPLHISLETPPISQLLLANQPLCRNCHDPNMPNLGIIEVRFSPDFYKSRVSSLLLVDIIITGLLVIVILLSMGYFIHQVILVPLMRLNATIIDVQKGNLNAQVDIVSQDEFGHIGKNFNQMIRNFRTTTQSLDKKVGELYVLNEVGKAMTSIFDLDELLRLIIILATEELHAETGSLMLIDKDTEELSIKMAIGIEEEIVKQARIKVGEGISGWVAKKGRPLLITDVENDDRFKHVRSGKNYDTKSLLSVPLIAHGIPMGVINVNNKRQGEVFTEEDLDLLSTLASQAAVAIENANLHEFLIEKERLDREMEIAHEIQMSLMPKVSPNFSSYNIKAESIPALQVGGDYFDFISIDDNTLGIAIGDVSGKGMPAALLMVMARSFIYTEARDTISPAMVLTRINELIFENKDVARPDMFITLFYCVIDSDKNTVTFANAGHDPPLLFPKDSLEPQELYSGDIMLGVFPNADYSEQTIKLDPGDLLFMYTDGIVEARNDKNELYGEKRMIQLILDNREKEVPEIKEAICQDVKFFVGDQPAHDDLTLVVVRFEEEYEVIRVNKIGSHFIPVIETLQSEIAEVDYFTTHRKNIILDNLTLDKQLIKKQAVDKLLEVEVQSVLGNLPFTEALVKRVAESIDFEDKEEIAAVIVAMNEATVNAIKYGNKNDNRLSIRMTFSCDEENFKFSVKDCGQEAFNPEEVANPTTNLKRLFKSSGRGIFMMRTFMDDVKFTKQEDGLLLTMTKALQAIRNEEEKSEDPV